MSESGSEKEAPKEGSVADSPKVEKESQEKSKLADLSPNELLLRGNFKVCAFGAVT